MPGDEKNDGATFWRKQGKNGGEMRQNNSENDVVEKWGKKLVNANKSAKTVTSMSGECYKTKINNARVTREKKSWGGLSEGNKEKMVGKLWKIMEKAFDLAHLIIPPRSLGTNDSQPECKRQANAGKW